MHSLPLSRAAEVLHADLIGRDGRFASVSTDTRTIAPGELYVALRGPNFDGHDFVAQAAQKGAVGAMVERPLDLELSQLKVADTRVGLGILAAAWRQVFSIPLVAVTGSNGKTTVKEMLAAILSCRGRVLATLGNLNNDIGMPLTLLRLQNEDYAVIELGANGPGEIGYLSGIARPDVVVLNNVGKAHLEGFGSLEGIARAKAEIISGLSAEGVVVINGDDRWAELWRDLAEGRRVLSFGVETAADVSANPQQLRTHWDGHGFRCRFDMRTPQGEVTIDLALAGRHNLLNALAAAAAAQALGAGLEDIREGLAGIRPVRGRLQTRTAPSGLRVIDDTYNANPDSVVAAIEVLVTAPGRRWLILGDLAELGPESERLLGELGTRARAAGLDRLCTLGTISAAATRTFGPGARHFADRQALIEELREQLESEDYVLVKGSRSAAMELVVNALLEQGGD